MNEWWPICSKVLAVFGVMAAGAVCRQVGWLKQSADESLMKLTVNVLLPCLFFHRVVGDPRLQNAGAVGWPPLVGFFTTVAGFALAGLLATTCWKMLRLTTPQHRRAFTLCSGMYNYGYIPLPVAETFFPAAVATMVVHNVGVEIALWTAGVLIASGSLGGASGSLGGASGSLGGASGSLGGANGSPGGRWWKQILSPPVVAIAAAVMINASGQSSHVPQLALDAADMLGRCGIPLGLVLSGAVIFDMLRTTDWRTGWPALAGAMALRTAILPVCFLLAAKYGPFSLELKQVMVIQASMPAASFTVVVARMYSNDADTAVRIVAGTTLLGVATIPLWMAIGRAWVGV